MQRIPDNLEVRTQHNGKRLILSIGVEGKSEGNGWREWKPFLDCGGHSEKKQNAAKALLEALAAKDAEIAELRKEADRLAETVRNDLKLIAPLRAKCAKMREILGEIRLDLVRFRCFECGYEHYEPVDGFFCPSCGKHALGSLHFSGPDQSTVARIDAILESEEA